MKKVVLLAFLFLFLFPRSILAEEASPEDYLLDFADSLPQETGELSDAIREGRLGEFSDMASLTRLLFDSFGSEADSLRSKLGALLGALILMAIATHVRPKGSQGSAVELGVSLVALALAYRMLYASLVRVGDYLDDLTLLSNISAPVMSVLQAAGGNVGGAAASESGVAYFLVILENLCRGVLLPFINVSFGFIAVGAVSDGLPSAGLLKSLRSVYTAILGFFSMLLAASLGMQSALASSSDGLLFKGVRYALGSMIPAVGGVLSGSLGAAAASVSHLKNTLGVSVAVAVLLLILPLFIELFIMRTLVSLSAGVGDMMGASRGASMLREVRGVYDMLIAVTVIPSLAFLFIVALFARTAVAAV